MNKLPLLKPKTTLQSSKCKEEINKLKKKKKYCCFLSSLYLASQLLRIWRHDVVVITTAQIHSLKPELRFC